VCVNTSADRTNCGGCNVYCPGNLACIGGMCKEPASCADWVAKEGALADGVYRIRPQLSDGGTLKPFSVYCQGMSTTQPKEYLELQPANVFDSGVFVPGTNFSRYGPAGACACQIPLVRSFYKVRLNVPSLVVDGADLTFTAPSEIGGCWSTQTGACGGANTLGYGSAANCNSTQSLAGTANIELHSTTFSVDPTVTWITTGFNQYGGASISTDRKTVNMTGGGACGGINPSPSLLLRQD
jgi:hypothetical protein